MIKLLILTTLLFLLHACNGDASQHEPREEKTLYFIDSPTNGIDYNCGERRGVTKSYTQNGITKHGLLKCVYSPITFSLGALRLGSVDNIVDEQIIYPQSLVNTFNGDFNNEEVLKIAILLQSLDDKSSPDYINIPQSTKNKITLKTLDNLSIEQLNQVIRSMGFSPVTKEDAKVHLVLNSPRIHNGKPSIEPFEEEISNELKVGDIVGELSIKKGDGELIYPFTLEGQGKEHFLLNNKGKLIVTQSFSTAQTFNLKVSIGNQYGYGSAPLNIHVKDSGKIGKVQLGRLKNATVKLFKISPNKTLELVTTETTKSTGSLNLLGNVDLHTELLDDQSYYVYEVSEGIDVDTDDDAKQDAIETNNHGKLHLISKGIWIKNSTEKIRITPLSEMLYTYLERDGFRDIERKLNKYSQILLRSSLDSESNINCKDIMIFNPVKDKKALYDTLTYNNTYNNIRNQIRQGDSNYKQTVFNAYVVDSFQSTAIEIVGSSIYTIDMTGTGEFSIYDLETKKKIGKLKLPNAPFEEDTHVIYVNTLIPRVNIYSLEDWSYEVDISKQNKPILTSEPNIKTAILSGSFSHTAIGYSQEIHLFGQERQSHIYDRANIPNSTRTIKFLNVDKNDIFYQFEFDSKLTTIDSLWVKNKYLYVIGDNKIHIFTETNTKATLNGIYNQRTVQGSIIGIEKETMYVLKENILTLYDISSTLKPKFIEEFVVPFNYKLGIKTNGKYIITVSKIIDIEALRASI